MSPVFLSLLFFLAFNGLMVKVVVEYNGFDLFGAISSTPKASKDESSVTALAYQKRKIDFVPFTNAKCLLSHQESGKSDTILQKMEYNFFPISVYYLKENVATAEKVIPQFEVSVRIEHDFTPMTKRLEKFTEVSLWQNRTIVDRQISDMLTPRNKILNFPKKTDKIVEKEPSENLKWEFQDALVKLFNLTHSLETVETKNEVKEQSLMEKKNDIFVAIKNESKQEMPVATKEICGNYNSSLDVDTKKLFNRTKNDMPEDSENEHMFYGVLNKILSTQPTKVAEITFTLFIAVVIYIILLAFQVLGAICLSVPTILELLNLKAFMPLPSFDFRDDSNISMIGVICTILLSSSYWLFIRPFYVAPYWQYFAMVCRRRAQIQCQKEERLRLKKKPSSR